MFTPFSFLSDTSAPEPLAARQNRLLQAFNHWQESVYFLQLRHPQTMQVAVSVLKSSIGMLLVFPVAI
jgi:hypothetical protein